MWFDCVYIWAWMFLLGRDCWLYGVLVLCLSLGGLLLILQILRYFVFYGCLLWVCVGSFFCVFGLCLIVVWFEPFVGC